MSIQDGIRDYVTANILFGDSERLDEDTSFWESGILDSIGLLRLITFAEERFGIQIADDDLVPENFDSVRRIAEFMDLKLSVKVPA